MSEIIEKLNFQNKVVVVAGGAGFLGKEISIELLKLNATVAVIDVLEKPGDLDPKIEYFRLSVPSVIEVRTAIMHLESKLGPIVGFINCIASREMSDEEYFSDLEDYSIENWNKVILGNLTTSFVLCREIGKVMLTRRFGSIVNFSSIYSSDFGPDLRIYHSQDGRSQSLTTPIPYSVSKGGVVALTRHLACAWADRNVRVNAISPGGVRRNQSDEFVTNYSKRIPLGRMANSKEIISLPIFLLTELASYITGQNLYIDGGLSSW